MLHNDACGLNTKINNGADRCYETVFIVQVNQFLFLQGPGKCIFSGLDIRRSGQWDCQFFAYIHGLVIQTEWVDLQVKIVRDCGQCFGQSKLSRQNRDIFTVYI